MTGIRLCAKCLGAVMCLTFLNSSQAAFLMTGGGDGGLPITGNDYNADLAALGFDTMRTGGYLSVDQAGFVDFYFVGAESTFSDTFTVTEHPSLTNSSFTEPLGNDNNPDPMTPFAFGGVPSFPVITIAVTAGERLDFQFSNSKNNFTVDNTKDYLGGLLFDLGIVYEFGAAPLNQVVLAYDDQLSLFGVDDNHDDMLIRADFRPVPVPAAVWLFGSGLVGLVGVARKRG